MLSEAIWSGRRERRVHHSRVKVPQCIHFIQHRRPTAVVMTALVVFCLVLAPLGDAIAEEKNPVPIETDASGLIVVEIDPRCSDVRLRGSEARVLWGIDRSEFAESMGTEYLLEADEFRIDTSKYSGGLEAGRFESMMVKGSATQLERPESSTTTSVLTHSALARDLRAGIYYHARVLVRTPDGWLASQPVGFVSPVCPADGLED